jgi:hypothetical protein
MERTRTVRAIRRITRVMEATPLDVGFRMLVHNVLIVAGSEAKPRDVPDRATFVVTWKSGDLQVFVPRRPKTAQDVFEDVPRRP